MTGLSEDSTRRTNDKGWEVGVRETVNALLPAVWQFLIGDGVSLWLGETTLLLDTGATYQTTDGVRGEVRSCTPNAKIRITWWPEDWPHDTLLQVTVREATTGTTIGFHHEQLADRDERKMMLGHWKNVIGAIASRF